jgi:hypothetical protein
LIAIALFVGCANMRSKAGRIPPKRNAFPDRDFNLLRVQVLLHATPVLAFPGFQAWARRSPFMPIRTPWSEAELRKLAKLHNVYSDVNAPERETCRAKIEALLREHGCDTAVDPSNPDLIHILKLAREALDREDRERSARNASPPPSPPATAPPPPPGSAPQDGEALFNYICEVLEHFIYFRVPEYRPAIAAWIMHTYVFRRFKVTPRLHVKSVVFW